MASVQNESKRAGANANASSSTRERHTSNVTSSNSNSNNATANATANANANSSNRYRSSPTPSQKSSSRYRNSPTQNAAKEKGSHNHNRTKSSSEKSTTSRSRPQLQPQSQSQPSQSQSPANNAPKEDQAIVTPELLVDALSGHEDGLLAIAERLMEHYDTGYDAMGEAIIDAFADVQKLFQHVVEAAHMEGAAYEAGRKEEEIEKLKRALGGEGGGHLNGEFENDHGHRHGHDGNGNGGLQNGGGSPPLRHEEFIDQDVRDVLSEAIRKGQGMKDSNKYADCFQIYEFACNNASSLLPVDSDHRGRLQLSIARAESMSPERACAILRYVMDDVLRSGLNSNSKVVMPDPSQRGDCVLSRPEGAGTISGRFTAGQGVSADDSGVLQSSEEALASLVEEMKEILSAPVYDNSPLQNVAQRFWAALSDAQRSNLKNEETLEQKLAILKAEFLLAREVSEPCCTRTCFLLMNAKPISILLPLDQIIKFLLNIISGLLWKQQEWEDKYNVLSHKCNNYKKNVDTLKHQKYMDQARGNLPSLGNEYIGDSDDDGFLDPEAPTKLDSPRPTHVSGSSSFVSLSQQAKSIASSFGCSGNRRNKTSSNRDSSPPSAASTWASRKTMSSGRG